MIFHNPSTFETLLSIECSGPEFANVISVSRSNGNTTINATLDPATSSCNNVSNVPVPLTLNLSGQANGSFNQSSNGVMRQQFDGSAFNQNFQSQYWNQTFNGTIGALSMAVDGYAQTFRAIDRQIVK